MVGTATGAFAVYVNMRPRAIKLASSRSPLPVITAMFKMVTGPDAKILLCIHTCPEAKVARASKPRNILVTLFIVRFLSIESEPVMQTKLNLV
jgi:hypothetical protein